MACVEVADFLPSLTFYASAQGSRSSRLPAASDVTNSGICTAAQSDAAQRQPKDAATSSRDQLPEMDGITSTPAIDPSPRRVANKAKAQPARSLYRFPQMALLLVRAKMVLNPRKKAAERSSTALSRLKSSSASIKATTAMAAWKTSIQRLPKRSAIGA